MITPAQEQIIVRFWKAIDKLDAELEVARLAGNHKAVVYLKLQRQTMMAKHEKEFPVEVVTW